jgi:putative tricarboxylic transport membrane protein
VTLLDSNILVPAVLSTALAGSYAIDMSIENVAVSLVFGIIGYLMMRYDYPRLMVVVALVLGGNIERNFHQSMLMGDGGWSVFFDRGISIFLMAAIFVLLALPVVRGLYRLRLASTASAEGGRS